jgi:hypothetical protein
VEGTVKIKDAEKPVFVQTMQMYLERKVVILKPPTFSVEGRGFIEAYTHFEDLPPEQPVLRPCHEIRIVKLTPARLKRYLVVRSRRGFVGTYRTLCLVPTPEMKAVFDGLQHLALANCGNNGKWVASAMSRPSETLKVG